MNKAFVLAGAAGLCLGAPVALASGETYQITVPEGGSPGGDLFALRYLGPAGGEVVDARLDIHFTTIGSFDAANLNIFLATPIIGDDGELAFLAFNGGEFGWSGQGTFQASIALPELTGVIAGDGSFPSLWQLDVLGDLKNDPPVFFGSFTDTAFSFKLVPAPGAAALLAFGGVFATRRRR